MIEQPTEEMFNKQKQFLRDLIRFEEPVKKLLERDLLGCCWDFDYEESEDLILHVEDVILVFKRYVEYDLTQRELYEWVSEIFGRDGIDWEDRHSKLVHSYLVSTIADYEIKQPLTREQASEYIRMLEQ